MGNERQRQRVSPIDMSEKRSEHIGEQDERHPLENPGDQLIRTPDQKPNDERRIDWNPYECSNPRDELRRLRHAAEIGACLLYTSDAADEEDSVDLGGRRII